MSRRKRGLNPEEKELWARVAASAKPLNPAAAKPSRPQSPGAGEPPAPAPKSQIAPFRIGATPTGSAARNHDFAPPVTDHVASMPLRMDRKTHRKMVRGRTAPEARIDLHGMTLAEARPELVHFILSAQARGKRLVLVITGKGKTRDEGGPIPQRTGVLRHQVPVWLGQAPLAWAVQQIAPAHAKHGGTGAYYVYLRRES